MLACMMKITKPNNAQRFGMYEEPYASPGSEIHCNNFTSITGEFEDAFTEPYHHRIPESPCDRLRGGTLYPIVEDHFVLSARFRIACMCSI